MKRLEDTFRRLLQSGKGGLIPFVTAGDPSLDVTARLIVELANCGASAIEIGVPFSDPMADGPVIQRSSERALRNKVGLNEIFRIIPAVRQQTEVPLVLFSYFNPLFQFGLERLAKDAANAGLDGVLVTDLPPEEATYVQALLAKEQLNAIYLAAPTTTDERLRKIAERATGFVYAVSRNGTTGMAAEGSSEAEILVRRLRSITNLPIAVGFGISNAAQVKEVLRYADAAVVGSAIVAEIETQGSSDRIVTHVGQFVRSLMSAN